MKNTLKIVIGLLAIGFVSCEADFDSPVEAEGFYTSGTADLSNYVALGNSLTAGYADGALYLTGQNNSYPNILANQFAKAGGGEFTQPLVADNLGGLLLNGTQIRSNRLVLGVDADGNPGPIVLDGTPTTEITTSAKGPFNNMGVPGAKSFHLVYPGYGNRGGVASGAASPYYARFATSDNSSVIDDAALLSPSFFSLWVGFNDILSYATSGGIGVDQAGNLDPATYGYYDISDPNVFSGHYEAEVNVLMESSTGGVLLNLADVVSIPFFTTVPVRSIPLDAATAAALNAQLALYNTQVLPGLVAFGIISAEEAAMRQVNFIAGINYPIIVDDDLTDISGILQGPPFNLDPMTAAMLGQLRQANDDDFVLLTASSILGSVPDPGNPQGVVGVSIPLEDAYVLTATEHDRVDVAMFSYNASIAAIAEANDLALVDAKAALAELTEVGVPFDSGIMTSAYVTGGAYSLDGVHLTPRGYAHTANIIIDAINRKYDATIPKVNIGNYGTITVSNN